jgi:hypothetical protein
LVVVDTDAHVSVVEVSMLGTVVAVTVLWAMTVGFVRTIIEALWMTWAFPERTIFSAPVILTDTSVILQLSVFHARDTVACVWSIASI